MELINCPKCGECGAEYETDMPVCFCNYSCNNQCYYISRSGICNKANEVQYYLNMETV